VALFKSIPAWTIILVLVLVRPLPAQLPRTKPDFHDLARTVTAASIPAPLPLTQFGALSATLFPTVIRAEGEESDPVILPFLGLQWWLSPNLALLGGLGSGQFLKQLVLLRRVGLRYLPEAFSLGEAIPGSGQFLKQLVLLRRVGLRYLPEALSLGEAIPEFIFVQGQVDGLAAYTLKWNELQWVYNLEMGTWNFSAGLAVLSYSIFPDADYRDETVGGKLKSNLKALILASTWKIVPVCHLAGRVIVHPKFISGGAQLSLAI
jgi:hypothetical protein